MQKVITYSNGHSEIVDISPMPVEIPVRYFDDTLPEIGYVEGRKSDWIDLRAGRSMFIVEGTYVMIPLAIAMALPSGYEAHIIPRSSTFKNFGLIQTNSEGMVDESYCGNDDQWHFPAYLVPGYGKQYAYYDKDNVLQIVSKREDVPAGKTVLRGTWVAAGDRLCQFRIVEHMPPVTFKPVPRLEGANRGGFGTTGKA